MTELLKAAKVGEVPRGGAKVVESGGRMIALFNVDGDYFAIDDACPHHGASLGCGTLEGEIVTCPWHGWKFNVKTGQMPMAGGVDSYPVSTDGDSIWIEV